MLSVIFQTFLDRYSGTEKVSSERSGHETTVYGIMTPGICATAGFVRDSQNYLFFTS
jgi:hypothetical protein